MATFIYYNPENGDLSFTVEFDESEITSELSEMIYGAIDNTAGYIVRKNDVASTYQKIVDGMAQTEKVLTQQLDEALQELAEYKHEYIPPHSRRKNGESEFANYTEAERAGFEPLDLDGTILDLDAIDLEVGDMNNMGAKVYDKTNV